MLCVTLIPPSSLCLNTLSLDFQQDFEYGANSSGARFEMVCSRCPDFSESGVSIDSETHPVCADLPKGVKALSSGTTLSTLDVEEGYYRVSAESHIVIECLNEDACSGGSIAGEYCARGYEGPCEYDTNNTDGKPAS